MEKIYPLQDKIRAYEIKNQKRRVTFKEDKTKLINYKS